MKDLTLCVPCFQRPKRTLRAVEAVLAQDMNNWEAFFIGDGCPEFQKLIDNGDFNRHIEAAKLNGNKLIVRNLKEHFGGWGYEVRNKIISTAVSKYTIFLDNDDTIKHNHFSNYFNAINDTEYDFVYLNTWIEPIDRPRISELTFGKIGHHEIIVKTPFLQSMPPQIHQYGHDWTLIKHMMEKGKYAKAISEKQTYIVKALGDFRTDTID